MKAQAKNTVIAIAILTFLIFLPPFIVDTKGQDDTGESSVFIPFLVDHPTDILGGCWPQSLPVGAIDGQPLPVFCSITNQGAGTSQSRVNSWIDEFNHGLSFADFENTSYMTYEEVGFVYKTIHWRHADHWMVDIASHDQDTPEGWVRGGALMRPNQSFHFEDGKFVVEVVVAAGIEPYGTNAWPEIVISTSPGPIDVGSLYAYDLFPEGLTVGCRLQATRYPVCAYKDDNGNAEAGEGSTRIWEMSAHQIVGTDNYGGFPAEGREKAWRVCIDTNPDMECRDHFRLELTANSLTLFVNGTKYFEQSGIPSFHYEFLNQELYVYFASMVVSHPAEALRFHWDDIRVNPESSSLLNQGLFYGERPEIIRTDPAKTPVKEGMECGN